MKSEKLLEKEGNHWQFPKEGMEKYIIFIDTLYTQNTYRLEMIKI